MRKCVRERIVRAFLIEEQKIVKKVLLEKQRERTKVNKIHQSIQNSLIQFCLGAGN